MKLHLLALGLLGTQAMFGAVWISGHGDIEMIYDGSEWEAAFLLGEEGEPPAIVDGNPVVPGTEFESGEITIRVGGARQPGAGLIDSGAATVYLLPQDEALASLLGNPFVGFAVDEISPGLFANDIVSLQLLGASGPGVFSLWETDAFGGDTILMSSAGGSGAPDALDLMVDPGHFHYNVGFSAAGDYEVTFRSGGDLEAGGSTFQEFTIRYEVVPEPGLITLGAIGMLGMLRLRRPGALAAG